MKVTHYICPKQSGKTTLANKLFEEGMSKGTQEVLLIETQGRTEFKSILKHLNGTIDKFKTVIIDEFLVCTKYGYDRDKLEYILERMGCKHLILFSTPDKLYDGLIYGMLKNHSLVSVNKLIDVLYLPVKKRVIRELNELVLKYLNPSRVQIIRAKDVKELKKPNINQTLQESKESYLLNIEGEFLK